MRNLLKEEKGSAIILLVLILAVFAGVTTVVTQSGLVYLTKSRLQNAVDAAALAGAQNLISSSTLAQETAEDYAENNGLKQDEVKVNTFSPTDGKDTKITVSATRRVFYTLTKLLGGESGWNDVTAEATAAIGAVIGVTGVMPLGVVDKPGGWSQFEELTLKYPGGGSEELAPGWCGWLYLNGYMVQDTTEDPTISGPINVDSTQDVKNGNVQKAVNNIAARISGHSTCTYLNHEQDCPRLVTVPIISPSSESTITILGFTKIFLDSIDDHQHEITGRFMGTLTTGEHIEPDETIYGLYGVKLVE